MSPSLHSLQPDSYSRHRHHHICPPPSHQHHLSNVVCPPHSNFQRSNYRVLHLHHCHQHPPTHPTTIFTPTSTSLSVRATTSTTPHHRPTIPTKPPPSHPEQSRPSCETYRATHGRRSSLVVRGVSAAASRQPSPILSLILLVSHCSCSAPHLARVELAWTHSTQTRYLDAVLVRHVESVPAFLTRVVRELRCNMGAVLSPACFRYTQPCARTHHQPLPIRPYHRFTPDTPPTHLTHPPSHTPLWFAQSQFDQPWSPCACAAVMDKSWSTHVWSRRLCHDGRVRFVPPLHCSVSNQTSAPPLSSASNLNPIHCTAQSERVHLARMTSACTVF
jgi:hypothetical protein